LRLCIKSRFFQQTLALNSLDAAVLSKTMRSLGTQSLFACQVVKHADSGPLSLAFSLFALGCNESFSLGSGLGALCALNCGAQLTLCALSSLSLSRSLFCRSALCRKPRLFGLFPLPLFALAPNLFESLNCCHFLGIFFSFGFHTRLLTSLSCGSSSRLFGVFGLKLETHALVDGLLDKRAKLFLLGSYARFKVSEPLNLATFGLVCPRLSSLAQLLKLARDEGVVEEQHVQFVGILVCASHILDDAQHIKVEVNVVYIHDRAKLALAYRVG
jgi:hypothetical protein